MQTANKTLILTEYTNLLPVFLDTFRAIKIERCENDNPLYSLDTLKNKIKEDGNLSFIKKEILSFIKHHGSPLIIMDMFISSNLDNDEGRSKIFKSFLLSYIIIMESEEFKNISCNMLILVNQKNYEKLNSINEKPQKILSVLKINDERINKAIQNYMTDQKKFLNNFNLLLINAEKEPSLIKTQLTLFNSKIIGSKESRIDSNVKNPIVENPIIESPINSQADKPIEKPIEKNQLPVVQKTVAAQAADVVIRIGNLFYKNNEEPVEYDTNLNLKEKEIYILGNFTDYTRLDVIRRLFGLLQRKFENKFDFKKENTIIINIPKDSVIDSAIPTTIAQLMSKELHAYKNVKIKIPLATYNAMQKVTGFTMIQRNIIITG